jgi:hypothetical protein
VIVVPRGKLEAPISKETASLCETGVGTNGDIVPVGMGLAGGGKLKVGLGSAVAIGARN